MGAEKERVRELLRQDREASAKEDWAATRRIWLELSGPLKDAFAAVEREKEEEQDEADAETAQRVGWI